MSVLHSLHSHRHDEPALDTDRHGTSAGVRGHWGGVAVRAAFVLAALGSLAHCSSSQGAPAPTADDAGTQPDGRPERLDAEAGFVTVPPQPSGAPYSSRMFYAFRPADQTPATKPLFVVFNGGPGYATTSGLMAYGTGPMTLVDGTPDDAPPRPNAESFTRFANLLYIDERATGFSYPLRDSDGGAPNFHCSFSIAGDAADFATVMLSFLEAHPALRDAPVFLMGESYGGTRAVSLLRILLHSGDSTLAIPDSLRAAVARHFGDDGAAPPSVERVARQFKGLVLLEPLVAGQAQLEAQVPLLQADPYLGTRVDDPHYDPYDLKKPAGWSDSLSARANRSLADPSSSRSLLGVDLATVTELLPPSRKDAFRWAPLTDPGVSSAHDDQVASTQIASRLGALGPNDYYLGTIVEACTGRQAEYADLTFDWFLDDLASVKLFLTHARWDGVIYTPAIPYVIEKAGIPTTVDPQPRAGYARPGWIDVMLPAREGQPAHAIEIRYPTYENSGHMVATCQGADFTDDVEQWLGGASSDELAH
jgi:hypothetical protein